MTKFLDKKEQIKSEILEFYSKLYAQIIEAKNNKDLKLCYKLYKLKLTLERAVYITALNDAIKEYERNDFKNKKADDFCYEVSKCNERLFNLLGAELDLLNEKAFNELRTL